MTDPRIEQKARELRERLNSFIDWNGEWDTTDQADAAIAVALQSTVAEVWEEAAKAVERDKKIQGLARVHLAAMLRARGQKETA